MKKTCAEYKDTARQNLLGHYGTLIAAMLVSQLAATILNIPFSRMTNLGMRYLVPSRIILGYAGMLIISLLLIVLSSGVSFMHLKLARGQEIRFSDLLYCFKNDPGKYMGFGLIIILITVLCLLPGMICMIVSSFTAVSETTVFTPLFTAAVLLYIAGFVVVFILMLGFSQSVYLMLDDTEKRAFPAMRESFSLMKGNKGRLFKLYLSFIGWLFLGLLTLGIGYLWIEPYLYQTLTQFYLDVSGQSQDTEYV